MKDGQAELKRLKFGILVSILVFLSPVILGLLFPPFSPFILAGSIVLPIHPIFPLNDFEQNVILIWDYFAVTIGIGSIVGLSLLYYRLRRCMDEDNTVSFTLGQKLHYVVSICLLMGGIPLTGVGMLLTVSYAQGVVADATFVGQLQSVAQIVGGIAALVIGAVLYRRNNPLADVNL